MSPIRFDYAVENGCNIISWPLTRPMSEVELYLARLEASLAKYPTQARPQLAMMRHTALYDNATERDSVISAIQSTMGMFQNLFLNSGDVTNGFPRRIPLEELAEREQYDPQMLENNLILGSPDEAVEKLRQYQKLGVDEFVYLASMGLSFKQQKTSLELFCNEVIPAFL